MDAAIHFARNRVLAPLHHHSTPNLQPNTPWPDKLFFLNQIERLSSTTNRAFKALLRRSERENLRKRNALIDLWVCHAHNSPSESVRNAISLIRHIAAIVAALNDVGVAHVTLCNARNDLAIVGHEAFLRNPHDILPAIARLGACPSPITEVEAWGITGNGDEVISVNLCKHRCTFVFSLVDTLLGVWSKSLHDPPLSSERVEVLTELDPVFSWMTKVEMLTIERRLSELSKMQLDVTAIASALDAREQYTPFLNVIVVGMRGTGKSTTRWLMTGRGREDVSETAANTTRSVSAVVDRTGGGLLVWDTPGMDLRSDVDQHYLKRIKDAMMDMNHMSAVMLQVTHPGSHTPQELEMLREYNAWFGGTLSRNLMIVFKASVNVRFRDRYIHDWEMKLDGIGVGRIGKDNYVFFKANTTMDDDESIVATNTAEIHRVGSIIMQKRLTVLEANRVAAQTLLQSDSVKRGERQQKLKRLLQSRKREETDSFREVIKYGRRVDTKYYPGQLHVTVRSYCEAKRVLHLLSLGFFKQRAITQYVIQSTCQRTKVFLEMMSQLPSVRRGQSDYWMERFFDERLCMQLMSLASAGKKSQVLHIFAEGIPVDERTIGNVVRLLGRRKALDILELVHDKSERAPSV